MTQQDSATRSKRPLIFGEVLLDQFPDGSVVLGGAPLNVAWNLRGLGFHPLLITRVGEDAHGERVISSLEKQGIDTSLVQFDSSRPTGTVQVTIDQGQPSFEIAADCAYDHIEVSPALDPACTDLLYCGTLALRSGGSRASFDQLLARTGADLFVDVNLRSPWWDREFVLALLDRARYAKLNDEELTLLGREGGELGLSAQVLLAEHHLDLLCVTCGAEGAACQTRTGTPIAVAPRSSVHVVDTVGAGDAFSSVLLAGFIYNWSLERTISRAQEFASAVVGLRGATSLDPGFYRSFSQKWSQNDN